MPHCRSCAFLFSVNIRPHEDANGRARVETQAILTGLLLFDIKLQWFHCLSMPGLPANVPAKFICNSIRAAE